MKIYIIFPPSLLLLRKHLFKQDYGNLTCGGYPGILGHLEDDANTFAEWGKFWNKWSMAHFTPPGVDYVKLDGCYSEPSTMDAGYPEFGMYLNKTKRPMVYSCSWPAYQIGQNPNYKSIAEHCNLWRNFDDIYDSWDSVLGIINYYGEDKDGFGQFAGPGHWNDPDMLIIGNYGLSLDQAWAQMGMWAMFARNNNHKLTHKQITYCFNIQVFSPHFSELDGVIMKCLPVLSSCQQIWGQSGPSLKRSYSTEILSSSIRWEGGHWGGPG